MTSLSLRLQQLASRHKDEDTIWDIGCDHGQLGMSFDGDPMVKSIHLVDPSESVISLLKQQLDSYITKSKVFIHHQKGQEVSLSSSSNLIFIAGMGGKEIGEILSSLLPQIKTNDRIVISPHRNILELRELLHRTDLRLEAEDVIKDMGRLYQVMVLSTKPELPKVSLYGESLWQLPLSREYRDQQLGHFREHRDSRSRSYCMFLEALSL